MKFALKTFIHISNENGGRLLLTFKMKNFHPQESFRILINGVYQFSSNEDTISNPNGLSLEPSNEKIEDFVYFESGIIPTGFNSIEIAVLSNFEQP